MSRTSLAFRRATPDHVPILLPLIRTAYRGSEGWTTDAAFLNDQRISPDGLLNKINRSNGLIFVGTNVETGELVSCCEVKHQASPHGAPLTTPYFGLFAVNPARQGGGVGKQVLAMAERFADEEWKVQHMEIYVIWLRSELIDCYVWRGYKRTGEKKPFPYEEVPKGAALRDDLYFIVLRKDLNTYA